MKPPKSQSYYFSFSFTAQPGEVNDIACKVGEFLRDTVPTVTSVTVIPQPYSIEIKMSKTIFVPNAKGVLFEGL
jgi:hypothetical protein